MAEQSPLHSKEQTAAGRRLKDLQERIIHLWEPRVRLEVKAAPSQTIPVLRNMLPELLQNLIASLTPDSGMEGMATAGRIGREHGLQRAGLADYTFSQVLLEYRILRQVIFEVLESESPLFPGVRDLILNTLDEGIEKAVEEFSSVRSEEIRRSNRDLQHFAAIAAHDLKSPLATITGFAELLDDGLRGKIGVDETEYVHAIKRSSARLTLLIDRLLEYSSVGRDAPVFEAVSTAWIVRDVVENLKGIMDSSRAELSLGELPPVFGDIALLLQLFQNFISNALKFSEPARPLKIHIAAEAQGAQWLFSIRDNGIGFNENDKENIFSLFKQLSDARTRPGQGIGLATARKVIEIHGGRVWAESTPGTGSVFYFTLPKVPDALLAGG